ncbi:hypothetical protein [Paenibacillus sp. Soil724D2]|uniref:hypothetical protein n=1 Tax=Paenibacillus sp. (strain Soil724D2) TaxID=1736392 RepID=UPI00071447DD|nr:hypothetical protein [Paenibacillus sp. Soil724D2]KRE50634.1 hypothetical protein ASG85_20490 [Paenibacillus sp. Soil724D2]
MTIEFAMQNREIGKDAALKWIEKIRKSGMDTLPIRHYIYSLDLYSLLYMTQTIVNSRKLKMLL